jgi:hypothetical protein
MDVFVVFIEILVFRRALKLGTVDHLAKPLYWSRGRCYDHNFRQFSAKKIDVFLKNQCYDQFFQKIPSSSLCKNAPIISPKNLAKIFLKIGPRNTIFEVKHALSNLTNRLGQFGHFC